MKYTIFYKNFVVREENNGTYSFLNKTTGQIFFLNSTSSFIFEHPEINDFDELIKIVHNNYPSINIDTIKHDYEDLLYKMAALGIASIDNVPHKKNDTCVAGEKDYLPISKFINRVIKDKSYLVYGVDQIKEYYNVASVRMRQFNNTEYNFIHYNDLGEIDACIVLGRGTYMSVLPIFGIFVKRNDIKVLSELFEFAFAATPEANKIRFSAKGDDDNAIVDILLSLGFVHEATLEKEIENADLKIYSKIR